MAGSHLPGIPCPVCNSLIPMEVWITHQGARQALVAMAELHGSLRLPSMAIRYMTLFAPEKRTLSFDRVADILTELGELIRPAKVEWKGVTYGAPMESWIAAMETMLADPAIRRPIKNHNYLRAVVAGMSDREEATKEARTEHTRQGHAGAGGGAERAQRDGGGFSRMPDAVRDQLQQFGKKGT